MNVIKIFLGRCLTSMSFTVQERELLRPGKQSASKIKNERVNLCIEFIEKEKNPTRKKVQEKFDWGDGIMERIHSDLIAYHDFEIKYIKKKKQYNFLFQKQETLNA